MIRTNHMAQKSKIDQRSSTWFSLEDYRYLYSKMPLIFEYGKLRQLACRLETVHYITATFKSWEGLN